MLNYNIPNGNLNKLEPNFFEKEKYVIHYELATLLKIRIETKKIYCVLEFNKSQWLKQYVEFNTQKRIEAEKMVDRKKSVAQINEQCCIWKNNVKIRTKWNQYKTCKQQKRLFKMDIQTKVYVAQNISK